MKKALLGLSAFAAVALSSGNAHMVAPDYVKPKTRIEMGGNLSVDKRHRRRLNKRKMFKAQRSSTNRVGYLHSLVNKISRNVEYKAVVNRMTNWQRNQWAKAGYPADVSTFANATR